MSRGDKELFPRRLDTNVAGAEGELTVNIGGTKAFVHDGKTPGGVPLVDALGPGLRRTNSGVTITNNRPIRIIGLGDSIVQSSSTSQNSGVDADNQPIPHNWNDGAGIFEQMLWKANGDTTSHCQYKFVANRGIAGQTTSQILARLQADVLDAAPDMVFIIAGTNDILTGQLESSIPVLMNNVEQMVIQCMDAGIFVFLCTPPCKNEAAPETQRVQPYYYDLANAYGIPLLDINRLVVNPANGAYISAAYSADGVHPTPFACDLISTEFAKALINPAAYTNRPYLAACSTLIPGTQDNLCMNGNFAQGLDGGNQPLGWTISFAGGTPNSLALADAAVPYTGKKATYTVAAGGADQVYAFYSSDINAGFSAGDVLELACSYKQTGFVPATSIGGTFQAAFDGPFSSTARPVNLLPCNFDGVLHQEMYVPQGCATINVQLYSQDKTITYALQNVTLTNRSYRQRVWTPGMQ